MLRLHVLDIVFLVILLPENVKLLKNGLALTPPMGWMSWGYYMCAVNCDNYPDKCLNENLILSVADTFYHDGYQEAGFEYIIIDDCWSEKERDENGKLVPDKKRFPNGMKYIADYIHTRGLKFGMYTNIAEITCMKYPGSQYFFDIDAQTFADWGVDYLKVDGCFVKEDYLNTGYIDLGQELKKTAKDMVYSCSWPYYIQFIHKKMPDYQKIAKHCNMWRNYHDVQLHWPAVKAIINHYKNEYDRISPYHGPGQWNDPDMIIFGTGALNENQSRVHYTVYLMLSAPILLSCDMNKITTFEKKLLQNLDLIAIGQDPLGIMAKPYQLEQLVILWVKPHLPMKGDRFHSFSFAIVNLDTEQHLISIYPVVYGVNSTDGYSVMVIFQKHVYLFKFSPEI
ncbi:unnamed protein product [Diatraea saccharalis]|uniref:Alpha-galactosidase n=1 Tax=Diatraea saccharalis TaxID=40085 RepID=A0A9N9WH15_9NEOP|nr:unnamed protein product [Diatraea saccharalis]